jgi:hypothetical protein
VNHDDRGGTGGDCRFEHLARMHKNRIQQALRHLLDADIR